MDLFDFAVLKNGVESTIRPDWNRIKNRPFYDTRKTRLRNTYEDWIEAGGDSYNPPEPTLSFIVDDEIFENITPSVYSQGVTKVYNLPTYEDRKYQIVAYTSEERIVCYPTANPDELIENWSIYPPGETGEIHYLDPKYIEDMYYTEGEEWGTTYKEWLSVVGENTTELEGKELTIKYNGIIYQDVAPSRIDNQTVYKITPEGESSQIVVIAVGTTGIWLEDYTSFLVKSGVIHKIPEKYYDKTESFIFHITSDNDGNPIVEENWDEVTEALDKGFGFKDFFVYDNSMEFLRCWGFNNSTTNDGKGQYRFDFIAEGRVYGFDERMSAFIKSYDSPYAIIIRLTEENSEVYFTDGTLQNMYPTQITVTEDSSGVLTCQPSDTFIYCSEWLDLPQSSINCICQYDDNAYNFETIIDDSVYFSTVIDGIYRRIKITQGTDGAADTVTIDKELSINSGDDANIMILYPTNTSSGSGYPIAINKNYDEIKQHLDNKGSLFLRRGDSQRPCCYYEHINDTLIIDFFVFQYDVNDDTSHCSIERITIGKDGSFKFSAFSASTSHSYTLMVNNQTKEYEFVSSDYEHLYDTYFDKLPCLLQFSGQDTVIPVSLRSQSNTIILTGFLNEKEQIVVEVTSDNKITVHTTTFESSENRVSEITEENSLIETAYPNVAAVKNYVDSLTVAPNITGASVGQIPVITAVDSDGKPTAWGSVDMPGGTDLNAVNVFVADFAHDTMTVTSGAVDKYARVVVS